MRRLRLTLLTTMVVLHGCATQPLPPETWSLAHLPTADLRDLARSPAFRVEMMIAMKVATERCVGPEYLTLNRTRPDRLMLGGDPETMMFGGPMTFDAIGNSMGLEYRRAYGDKWWDVASAHMRAARAKYENHPDPASFCAAAEAAARQAFETRGRNQVMHLAEFYWQMAPDAGGWQPPPPETWSLSHLRQATLSDMDRNAALRVELIVALRVAYERCSKAESPIVKRLNIETLELRASDEAMSFGRPWTIAVLGRTMGNHYRYVYGDQWFDILSSEMRQTREKYENHPDRAAFCRAANDAARLDIRGDLRTRTARLDWMYRQLSPENTRTSADDDAR